MMRVADNPHKPGTAEHRDWQDLNIHWPRSTGGLDWAEAKAAADARLAVLKAQVRASHGPNHGWVENILREVEEATRPRSGFVRRGPARLFWAQAVGTTIAIPATDVTIRSEPAA